jgi:hypothetical protein
MTHSCSILLRLPGKEWRKRCSGQRFHFRDKGYAYNEKNPKHKEVKVKQGKAEQVNVLAEESQQGIIESQAAENKKYQQSLDFSSHR